MILCRLCARLSRVRPCTLLSAFAQAPRLTRNCFPNRTNAQSIVGFARGCGANGRQFPRDTLSPLRTPQSCTSLYTPFGVYAGSSSDAELLSKRGANAQSIVGLAVFLSRVRSCTLPSKNPRPPRLARGCGANGRQFPRDTLSPLRTPQSCTFLYTPFGVCAGSSSDAELLSKRGRTRNPLSRLRAAAAQTARTTRRMTLFRAAMSATGAAGAPCPPRAWSARSILQSKRRVVRYENRRRH